MIDSGRRISEFESSTRLLVMMIRFLSLLERERGVRRVCLIILDKMKTKGKVKVIV